MSKIFLKLSLGLCLLAGSLLVPSAGAVSLPGSVPSVVAGKTPLGRFAATNVLRLSIGLPLTNQAALNTLLSQIYTPTSTNYHKFLTPAQFAAQFGPSTNAYLAVVNFAQTNGLTIVATPANRMLVEVSGQVSDIERAFNISLFRFQHPTENRVFFAPTNAPSVPASLSILDVSGLNSYVRPRPKLSLNSANKANLPVPKVGSGPFGSYMGYDFRSAYVPGTPLTGTGQKIALVQFDGYLASDIALYAAQAGLPTVALTNILLNGFSGIPTGSGGEVEVSLDIEMVISMAPGLNQVMVYEGDPFNFIPNVVLNQIAVDNAAKQVSCSWGWIGGPNASSEQIFQQMAVQGQSFFNASGDSDAFLPGEVDNPGGFGFPSCSPNITQVGGTTLTTTGPGGAYVSETVWNWGGGVGSSGGSSSFYPIPVWQQWINMTTNHGSSTGRNIPDVALTGDNVYVIADNGVQYPGVGGTSCAAPLWAGFMALVNQQAELNGRAPAGFINPAIYNLAQVAAYNNTFNDITNGNNTWALSPTNFFAVPNYDLCTGLGTPKGTNLINALVGVSNNLAAPIISAPAGPWGTNLAGLNGSNPNGGWFLFVQDDKAVDSGIISNGWFVTLTSANPVGYAADNALYIAATNSSVLVGGPWTCVLALTNYGPSTSSNIYVTDTLPINVPLISTQPSVGSVTPFGSTLVWNVGNLPLNTGATLTLNFQPSATGIYSNAAVVISDADPNPDDDAVGVFLTVTSAQPPVLSLLSYSGGSGFQFSVTGNPGSSTIIQGSTNLVNWVSLYTNVSPFAYTDSAATNYPQRFYRAVLAP